MELTIGKYKGYNIYLYEGIINNNLRNLYFYISNSSIHFNYITTNNRIISHIHYIYDIKSASMIFLKTKKNYKNKGFASILLKKSIKYLKNKKVKKIELDDMSNHSHSKNNNIYINHNFKYINPYPEPEMVLELN